MRMLLAVVVVVVGCAGLAACAGPEDEGGGGDGVPELDAGPDSGTDAGDVDAGTDAGDVLRCPADFDCSPGDHCRDDGTCETCPVPVAAEACAAAEASCGKLIVTVCGVGREVDCGGCSFGTCGSVTANSCPVCVPNTAAERCAAAGRDCGAYANRDNCNVDVVDDCGTCSGAQDICKFGHCCTPKTQEDLCHLRCGTISAYDGCSATVTYSCGPSCPEGLRCTSAIFDGYCLPP